MKRLDAIPAYPLQWPTGWKRTPSYKRQVGRYKVDFAVARDQAMDEVRLLGANSAVLSTNIPVRKDGLPYNNFRQPDDPGVALYWTVRTGVGEFEQRVIACDAWRTVRDNMRAVCLAIAAIRSLERTGATEIMDRAYQGFAALPAGESWRDVLGFRHDGQLHWSDVQNRYRELARKHHPDRGGDPDFMVRLNRARDDAQQELGR